MGRYSHIRDSNVSSRADDSVQSLKGRRLVGKNGQHAFHDGDIERGDVSYFAQTAGYVEEVLGKVVLLVLMDS